MTPFKKGEFVCQYISELIPYKDAKQREKKYCQSGDVGCFMYYFWHKDKHF